MVEVEIRSPVYDTESGSITWRGRAIVRADGGNLEIHPVDLPVDLNLVVVDLASGRQISGHDDPELWARNLPQAFRSGDLVAAVLQDTDPPAEPWMPDDRRPPVIPAPPRPARQEAPASLRA